MKNAIKCLIPVFFACISLLFTACKGQSSADSLSDCDPSARIDYTCKELCEYIVDNIELPIVDELTDKDILADVIDTNNDSYDDYCVYQQLMSVHLCEIVIIITSDEKASLADLEERKKNLIELFSFYPEQNEAAEKTIVGRKGNYSYLIAAVNSDDIEKLLLSKIV